jgi:lipoprotein signal peptidase
MPMMVLALTAIMVLVIDQAAKVLLRSSRFESVGLGPFGTLRTRQGPLWVHRAGQHGPKVLWLWIVSAGALVVASAWLPGCRVFVGLLLGGSLSNAMEGSLRGSVTDYVCLRFWPAFNLADVAITAGAIGMAIELLRALGATAA